ncbi:uncharacterized protein LOC110092056 isoform X1 [Dendrobium catenatum]|uniref:uncharacterized protein LOC110092056 isoform X1 n=1 Tax=Dendrobium catenatum TaxID=906689 RepID=UPI0009F2776D|nr:uncharacterized protein LOC110092056 isoform X1 [Dendrobium catenatum]XP_028548322.1 uncharacterized protein LOC110092056 isoform X1 [Dendrobium catenatum]
MVLMMARWADRAAGLLNSAKSPGNIASKLDQLRQLRDVLLIRDSTLLPEFAPRLTELEVQLPGAARKLLAEILGEIGKEHVELLPAIVPTLITYLKDETPPVARQAIVTGTSLFCNSLVKIAIQGLNSSELDETLKSSWAAMLKLKNAVLPLAIQPGIDGVRLLAVKFIEAMVLLYTPDPTLPSDPPQEIDGLQFSISWLKGGHPLLNVGDLAIEAGQSLRLLLDQLKFPQVKFLSNSIVIVLINSVSVIAKRRPSFYGRILPVLLSLDPELSVIKGVQVPGAHHALKNAFMACLQCTHSSAAPWRARLVEALRVMNGGEPGEELVKNELVKNEKSPEAPATVMGCYVSSKEEKSLLQASDEVHSDLSRKRSLNEESQDALADDFVSEKRIRQSPTVKDSVQIGLVPVKNEHASCDSLPSTRDGDSGPVLQLVGMFGALVAQGEKASEPLEILISSISSDLLAEVVLANMRHLPSSSPMADDEDESNHSMSSLSDLKSSTSASNAFSLSSAFSLVTARLKSQQLSQDMNAVHIKHEEDVTIKEENKVTSSSADHALIGPEMHPSVATSSFFIEKNNAGLQLYENDSEAGEGKIPGLDSSTCFNETLELPDASLVLDEIKEATLEHAISSGVVVSLDISPSTSTVSYSMETFSPRATATDASETPSTASHVSSSQYFLPKMVLCNIDLTDDQKDQLQKVAFMRILDAYKQVTVSGGSSVHLSLLAHLGTEFPLDLDPWGVLQKHVVSDYVNHEGHELTLRVLYRLYREAEQDQDFLSSRTATSVYETFLLDVAEALRDTFSASDKSLGRLLGEVPYLSESVLRMLECLCSPESKEKLETDFQHGDRVTQGLSAVWSLILLRPSSRDRCLQIVLQSAVHHLEEVRMKAIRLVANKLFPMSNISQKIEDFASEKLRSVLDDLPSPDDASANESSPTLQKICIILLSSQEGDLRKPSSRVPPFSGSVNTESVSEGLSIKSAASSFLEAQRCISLYFALCTKKHSLLRQIFAIYKRIPKAAIEAVHRHIPILVRTIGSSPELLSIVLDPPPGSDGLLMLVLQILTDGAVPSQELISSVKRLYNSKLKDAEILIPILSFLSKDEILPLIPQFVSLPSDKFQVVLTRILQGSTQSGDSLTPAEILISIHGIDSEKDGVPLKKIMDACSACFEQRLVFTQQVLAKVLNQLVEQIPLPLLFMRTVIQAIGVFPGLVDFVMEILSRLVSKQIWKYPKLWVGFLKCALQTKPQSFNVLLQLPAAQLENALSKNPVLKSPLMEHANQPNIRSTLPRSSLVVLGLANDPQRSGQVSQTSGQVQQINQNQSADTASSTADPAAEVTQ